MMFRKGVTVLVALLFIPVTRPAGCQVVVQDSLRLFAAREAGRRAADSSSMAGWFAGGLLGIVNPVLPIIGVAIPLVAAVSVARPVVPARYRATFAAEPEFPAQTFAAAYAARISERRTGAVLRGALVGAGVVLAALLVTLGNWE